MNSHKVLEPDSFLANKIIQIKHDSILKSLQATIDTHPDIALEAVGNLVKVASADRIKQLIGVLSQQLSMLQTPTSPPPIGAMNSIPEHDEKEAH